MKLWIARDKDGYLFLFDEKPNRYEFWFDSKLGDSYNLKDDFFPEVTFENSPKKVEIKLVK